MRVNYTHGKQVKSSFAIARLFFRSASCSLQIPRLSWEEYVIQHTSQIVGIPPTPYFLGTPSKSLFISLFLHSTRIPYKRKMEATHMRCYLKTVKQNPSLQSGISIFRRWQKDHADSDMYNCHIHMVDGKPCLSKQAEDILSGYVPELSLW